MSHKLRAILVAAVGVCLVAAMAAPASAASVRTRTRSPRPAGVHAASIRPAWSMGADPTPNDAWDPADDTTSGARPLPFAPSSEVHNLAFDSTNPADFWDYDFFVASLTAGRTYRVRAIQNDATWGSADPMIDVFKSSDITAGVVTSPKNTVNYLQDWPLLLENDNASYEPTHSAATDGSSQIYFTPTVSGEYTFVVGDGWFTLAGGQYWLQAVDLGVIPSGTVKRVDQLAGTTVYDRYAVAAGLAEEVGKSQGATQPANVIIASGLDKAAADPLAAGPLAGLYNAPILLVRADTPYTLPTATRDYLLKLRNAHARPITFTIVGGTASVPDSLKTRLLAVAPVGSRIGTRYTGIDRYAVAASVAARVRSLTATNTMCFITNGATPAYFYDTLAVSALAAKMRIPILLTRPTFVPPVTAVEASRYKKRTVVGATMVITPATASALKASERIGFSGVDASDYDRTLMSRLVAEYAYDRGWMTQSTLGVTNKLADALVGGAAMGRLGAPVLFTGWDTNAAGWEPEYTGGLINQLRPSHPTVYVIGGSGSVAPSTFNEIRRLIQ